MLTAYLAAAMRHARYEILAEDATFYGEIPECRGVSANAATLEACREELAETLEDWVLLSLHRNLSLPTIDSLELTVRKEAAV
ncbi:MAG: type II toxin-antitoxin system HicB family antitoxin [Armatimonadetes bacterium]|nr:type II toxin-antitoxin system HicB family antitoxin [Armatimonadota bacterium]